MSDVAGPILLLTCCLACRCVDLRTGAFDVPPQEILTRDSVTVSVDAVVYYQVPAAGRARVGEAWRTHISPSQAVGH